jgi:hypothetical protein
MVSPAPLQESQDVSFAAQGKDTTFQHSEGAPKEDGDIRKAPQNLLHGDQQTRASPGLQLFPVKLQPAVPSAMEPRISPDKESLVFIAHSQVCQHLISVLFSWSVCLNRFRSFKAVALFAIKWTWQKQE